MEIKEEPMWLENTESRPVDSLSGFEAQEENVIVTDVEKVFIKQEPGHWEDEETCVTSVIKVKDELKIKEEFASDLNNPAEKIEVGEENTESTSRDRCFAEDLDEEVEGKIGTLFICSACGKSYRSKRTLREHLRGHEKAFECSTCQKSFCSNSYLQIHLRSHLGILHSCLHCSTNFSTEWKLKEHMRGHESEFKCSVCLKLLLCKRTLQDHMRSHYGGYKCSICSKSYSRKDKLKVHIKRHETVQFTCKRCLVSFSTEESLQEHVRSHENIFRCSICPKVYISERSLRDHVRCHEGSWKCSICFKSFSSKFSLKEHSLGHIGGYKCSLCIKSYCNKGSLKRHVISHEGVLYACPDCCKPLPTEEELRSHLRTHWKALW